MEIHNELRGADAVRYAKEHLKKVKSDPRTWITEYIDERDGSKWLIDYPESEHHGGGSPRLRKVEKR